MKSKLRIEGWRFCKFGGKGTGDARSPRRFMNLFLNPNNIFKSDKSKKPLNNYTYRSLLNEKKYQRLQ